MQDNVPYGKLVFWSVFLAVAALATVPSLVLIDSVRSYCEFLSGWTPGVLPATRLRRIAHAPGADAPRDAGLPAPAATRIVFVDFLLEAPRAKRVLLAGDFNRWRPEALRPSGRRKGRWELQLPLPPGRYQYLYQVDGVWTPDPASPPSGTHDGIKASVREVHPVDERKGVKP